MILQTQIEGKLQIAFSIAHLQLENESHMHSGNNPESHFKLTLVTNDFEGMGKVKRHQAVYKALAEEMPQFHALALHTFSEAEWQASDGVAASPQCAGGSKA